MGRALAGHFALANWFLRILSEMAVLMHCTYLKIRLRRLGEFDFVVLPSKWLGSSPPLRFSSIAKGLDTSRWAGPKRNRVRVHCEVHRVNCNLWPELFLVVSHRVKSVDHPFC